MVYPSLKNLTNKKQKNLKVTLCNPAEPRHCKSRANDTVYTDIFFGTKLDMVFEAEVMNYKYLRNSFLMFYTVRM